jgi:uncharacterized protein (DUF1684 family)
VGDLYRLNGVDALSRFRQGRNELFASHPQSPLSSEARARFRGLDYFEGDPSLRIACQLDPSVEEETIEIDTGGEDGVITYRRAGLLRFRLEGQGCKLTVFTLLGYGGGLFLPFRDATSGRETYGGGRYLFDTVKNTDGLALEIRVGSPDVVIDFNYAYNPSCAYDARFACPLPPPENWLSLPVRGGEKVFAGAA